MHTERRQQLTALHRCFQSSHTVGQEEEEEEPSGVQLIYILTSNSARENHFTRQNAYPPPLPLLPHSLRFSSAVTFWSNVLHLALHAYHPPVSCCVLRACFQPTDFCILLFGIFGCLPTARHSLTADYWTSCVLNSTLHTVQAMASIWDDLSLALISIRRGKERENFVCLGFLEQSLRAV